MKNKNHNYSKLKHELYQERGKGKKHVVRKLKPGEVDYLSTIFLVAPYLYEIKLSFDLGFNPKIGNHPSVIKDLYFNYYIKGRKRTIYRTLNKNQVSACERYGLTVTPFKYKIILV